MPNNSSPHIQLPEFQDQRDTWFEDLITQLKTDQFLLETNSAPKEKADFYKALIQGDIAKTMSQSRNTSSKYFLSRVVFDYLAEIQEMPRKPHNLSLGFSDAQILVWAEIDNDDEEMEDLLLIAEANMNAKYLPDGFYIKSTIVEKSHSIPTPPHYQSILA